MRPRPGVACAGLFNWASEMSGATALISSYCKSPGPNRWIVNQDPLFDVRSRPTPRVRTLGKPVAHASACISGCQGVVVAVIERECPLGKTGGW
jgi:hypothetical protein